MTRTRWVLTKEGREAGARFGPAPAHGWCAADGCREPVVLGEAAAVLPDERVFHLRCAENRFMIRCREGSR